MRLLDKQRKLMIRHYSFWSYDKDCESKLSKLSDYNLLKAYLNKFTKETTRQALIDGEKE